MAQWLRAHTALGGIKVKFSAPMLGDSQWPVFPALGSPIQSSGLHGHLFLLIHTNCSNNMNKKELGVLLDIFNPSTQEAEAGGLL